MLSDVLSILKFATDPQTRDVLGSILNVASKKQSKWVTQVQTESFEFNPQNWPTINAFSNDLFHKIRATGVSPTKFNRFTTIYTELINNAYHHGCKGRSKWKIVVKCIYCRWFIQLDVQDDGKGFLVDDALKKIKEERWADHRKGRSGLELVRDLSDSMYVEGKKSKVTILIAGENRINIFTSIEKFGKNEMLIITWVDKDEWSFLSPDWEPLREALVVADQTLILVRFDNPSIADRVSQNEKSIAVPPDEYGYIRKRFSTQEIKQARPIITESALDPNHLFAYLISDYWVYDDLKELETENLRFFVKESDARKWLLMKAKTYFKDDKHSSS